MTEFKTMFQEALIIGRNLHEEEFELTSPEQQERFLDNQHRNSIGLLHLLPSECAGTLTDQSLPSELTTAVDFYKDDLPHHVMFITEYHQWVRQWTEQSAELPKTLVDAQGKCNHLAYPNLHALLCLAVTLPITSAESERSFSQRKLIKTAR